MKIDTRFESSPVSSSAVTQPAGSGTSFRDLFETARTRIDETTSAGSPASPGKTESAHETAVRELHEYLQKTPEQRMREAILKEMGMSEEDIAKMPPEERNAIESAIKEKVKEKLLEQAQQNVDATRASGNERGLQLPML